MAKLFDRAGMTTATTGTGTVTLVTNVTDSTNGDLRTFANAGVVDGDTVPYLIVDGSAWEEDEGVAGSTATTLTRPQTANFKSSTGSLISLSGTAKVYIVPRAVDVPRRGRILAAAARCTVANY